MFLRHFHSFGVVAQFGFIDTGDILLCMPNKLQYEMGFADCCKLMLVRFKEDIILFQIVWGGLLILYFEILLAVTLFKPDNMLCNESWTWLFAFCNVYLCQLCCSHLAPEHRYPRAIGECSQVMTINCFWVGRIKSLDQFGYIPAVVFLLPTAVLIRSHWTLIWDFC